MSVNEIKKKHIYHLLIFKKIMRFTPDKNTNLKKNTLYVIKVQISFF